MKKLYRSKTNRIISGVIGGLAEYLKLDVTILRLVYVILTVFTGFVPGLVIYILAIFIIPEES